MRLGIPSPKLLKAVDTAIGTLLCASAALMLSLMFNQTRLEVALPLICMAIVVAVAARFGVATGVFGSLACALLLAYFVYAPEGSFRISDVRARGNISWLLLGGISLSFLFAPNRSRDKSEAEHHD
jgi:integral membrane sensor domain MASE1